VAALPVPQWGSTRGGRTPLPPLPPRQTASSRPPPLSCARHDSAQTVLGRPRAGSGRRGLMRCAFGGQREHSAAHASRTAPSPRVRRRWWGPRGAATRRRAASPPTCAGRARTASVIRLNCDYRRTASTGGSGSRGSTSPQRWHASHTGAGRGPAGSLLCLAQTTVSFHDLRKGRDGAIVA